MVLHFATTDHIFASDENPGQTLACRLSANGEHHHRTHAGREVDL